MIHVAINTILISGCFALGLLASRLDKASYVAFAASGCLAILPGRPDWFVSILPFSWAVFYSNLYPFAAALAIPSIVSLSKSRAHTFRLRVLCAALMSVTLLPYCQFLLPAATTDRPTLIDTNGICRQTSDDTCGAAVVVTLLGQHGIRVTEDEAIRCALTKRKHGTTMLGQYRALKLLSQASTKPLRVRLQRRSVDELIASGPPSIIMAGLGRRQRLDTEEAKDLVRLYQWTPGAIHNVVFMGVDHENPALVRIGEPDFGLERWRISELRLLHQGFALWLEEVP